MLSPSPTWAATEFYVGNGADCDFADLQSAIDASDTAESTIRLARPQLSGVEASLSVSGILRIEGGFSECGAVAPTAATNLVGSFSASVLDIEVAGSGLIVLRDVLVTQGSALEGGGLSIRGPGEVRLENVEVAGNDAERGGGISLREGTLRLLSSTVVSNRAILVSTLSIAGGGLHCSEGGRIVLSQSSQVLGNSAREGVGGGFFLKGGCHLEISSSGSEIPSAIEGNTARHGGGVLALGDASVVLDGDSLSPVVVRANRAEPGPSAVTSTGGGLLLSGGGTTLVARNVQVEDNVAIGGLGGGVAVFAGAEARIVRTRVPSSCHTADRCSRLGGNRAARGAAAVVNGSGSTLEIVRSYVENNVGDDSVLEATFAGRIRVDGSVFGENEALHLIHLDEQGQAEVAFTTIAANDLTGFDVVSVVGDSTFELVASIVFEPGFDVIAGVGAGEIDARCVLTFETDGLENGVEIQFGFPAFVNAPVDYHLTSVSQAIDFCTPALVGPIELDIDLGVRGVDALNQNRSAGSVFDLGADEFDSAETVLLFSDGFESGDLSGWTVTAGANP